MTDHSAVAFDAFNAHFSSVFNDESNQVPVTELSTCLHFNPLLVSSLTFTEEEVYHELMALNPSKACGPGGIPLLLLLNSAEHISSPLSILLINLFPLVKFRSTGFLLMSFQYIRSLIKVHLPTTDLFH